MKTNHTSSDQLLLYLVDELSPGERKTVEAHLRSCRVCQKLLEEQRSILHALRAQPKLEPSETLLDGCRTRLRHRLQAESAGKSWIRFLERIRDGVPAQIPTRQLAVVTAVFLFGLVVGRFLPDRNGGASAREALLALQSSMPVGNFRVAPTAGGADGVEIRFDAVQEKVLQGSLEDPDIRYALSYALVNDPRDDIRLKTVDLLGEATEDELVRKALIHTLENDENPGVRLKAIKILKTLPVNESIKKILIGTLFKDSNAGVRIEAARALDQMEDPDVQSILEKRAKYDEYIQALFLERDKSPVSLSRDM